MDYRKAIEELLKIPQDDELLADKLAVFLTQLSDDDLIRILAAMKQMLHDKK